MFRRPALLIPALLLGAILYWGAAFGLGGLSLALLTPDPELEIVPQGDVEDAIVVRLQEEPPPPVCESSEIGLTSY